MVQRRDVRIWVMQALYAEEISHNDFKQLFLMLIKPKLKDGKESYVFAEELFFETLHHHEDFDSIIEQHINNWGIERLTIVDKVILRMALCEFIYFEQIPIKVTMNEAIEIAKDYSTTKSGNFINGILDAALAQLKQENKIQKKGRGLIQSSVNQ